MLTGDVLRDQAAMLREMASRRRVCGNSPGEVHDLEMIARTLDTLAPEASGADYVMVPRDLRTECGMHEAGVRARNEGRGVAEMWALILAAAPTNPAPPTSGEALRCPDCSNTSLLYACVACSATNYPQPTPADESGAEPMMSCREYPTPRGICVECNTGHPERCLWVARARAAGLPIAGHYAEPKAAAQEGPYRGAMLAVTERAITCMNLWADGEPYDHARDFNTRADLDAMRRGLADAARRARGESE